MNTGTTTLEVYLQPNGAGSPIYLKAASTLTSYDGGSLEFNGYNGQVWTVGNGYVYAYAQ
jgi:ABC-type iron transport system FetAB ATPase subunit